MFAFLLSFSLFFCVCCLLLVLVLELGSSAHCHISTHMSEEYPLPFGVSFILGNALCASD